MIEVSVYHLMGVLQHCKCQNSNMRLLLLSTDLIHFDGYEELQVPLMAFWRISAAAVMSNPPVADACQDPHPVFRFQSKFRSCNSQCHYKCTCALLRTDRDTRTYKADVIGSCLLLQRWKITEYLIQLLWTASRPKSIGLNRFCQAMFKGDILHLFLQVKGSALYLGDGKKI